MYVLSAQFVNWAEPGDMRYGADHSPHDGNEKHNSKSYFFIILIASENMNMYRGKESDKKKTARIERHHHNSRTLQIPHRYTRLARNRIDVGKKKPPPIDCWDRMHTHSLSNVGNKWRHFVRASNVLWDFTNCPPCGVRIDVWHAHWPRAMMLANRCAG